MLLKLLCYLALNILLSVATENAKSYLGYGLGGNYAMLPNTGISGNIKPGMNMSTYIEKTENILRVPIMKNYLENTKKKTLKKSPKRTIQKIIKKSKSRRKLYLNQATSTAKVPLNGDALDKFYAQEETMQKYEINATSQVNHKHNKKTRNTRVGRYPMPFKHMASWKDNHKRNKRSEYRRDAFIITDFDEVEFLSHDKNKDVFNAHVKKYW